MSLITQKDSVVIFYIEGDARHEILIYARQLSNQVLIFNIYIYI